MGQVGQHDSTADNLKNTWPLCFVLLQMCLHHHDAAENSTSRIGLALATARRLAQKSNETTETETMAIVGAEEDHVNAAG